MSLNILIAISLMLVLTACGSDSKPSNPDADGDGVPDASDVFPNDPKESQDTDGDGVGDNADAFPEDATETTDTDSDGVGDNADAFPENSGETIDTDNDGVGDNTDAFPEDPSESVDTDNDTIGDNADNCPGIANLDQENFDVNLDGGDTLGDACDSDDDADGVNDTQDTFPYDQSESNDNDEDGIGDNADPNDDNDPRLDNEDPFPFDPAEWEDADLDNIGDDKDLDVGADENDLGNNPASIQLDRFHQTNRATLFIGPDTSTAGEARGDVQVTNAGDVNGDNLDDLLIGVAEDYFRDGRVYLFFGSETPWPKEIDLAKIPETVDHIIFEGGLDGAYPNLIGNGLSLLGDVNGDDIDDFIMGGIGYELDDSTLLTGEAYLIFGRTSWLDDAGEDKTITMAEIKSDYAIVYQGQQDTGDFGERVILAGDVNGDNYNDFLISEYGFSPVEDFDDATGRVHLIFGGEHLQPPATEAGDIRNIDTLPASERITIITERLDSDPTREVIRETIFGDEILGIGNFNNDANGYDDIAITSTVRDKVYVLFGRETWPATITVPDIENGTGLIFEAPSGVDDIGIGSYIAAGDLNGDSIPELAIAQTNSTDESIPNKKGDVVILKGGVGSWPSNLSLDNLTDFFGVVWSTDEALELGGGLAVLPDNNNDGFAELLIAGPKPEATSEGLIFKVTGQANLTAKTLNSTTTDTGVEIIRNLHPKSAGQNMRVLGDYNGDGINEFVIDIQDADTDDRTENGLFYVIHGYSSLYPE